MTDGNPLERCSTCDARNPVGAEWCGQCYTPLAAAPSDPPAAPASVEPAPASAPADPPGLLPLPPGVAEPLAPLPPPPEPPEPPEPHGPPASTLDPATLLGGGRFRETGAGLEWSCGVCDEWNALELVACTRCYTPFGPTRGAETADPLPEVTPGLLLGASFVLPGAGHALLGLWGEAFPRLLLGLVWGIGGVSMLVSASSSGSPALPAIPLLFGWVVLALSSANDAHATATGAGRVLLAPRRLLWLVVAVIGLTALAAVVGAFSAVSR